MASIFKRGGKKNRDGRWYIEYFDENGKRKTVSSRTTDRAAAGRIAAKYETDVALRREGVIDPVQEATAAQAKRSIADHIEDYRTKLSAAGRDGRYINTTCSVIRKLCDFAGFTTITAINSDGVSRYLQSLTAAGKSSRTLQNATLSVHGFTKWLVMTRKLRHDPLAGLKNPNPKANRKFHRRALLPAEWQWLRPITLASGELFGMPGAERALLYAVALQTGLRSTEIRSLVKGKLFLDSARPFVLAPASATKNAKQARQFIQPETADALRAHVAGKLPQVPVFCLPRKDDMAKMLQADMLAAREAWLEAAAHDPAELARRHESDFLLPTNAEGEILDFHSLRHSCGVWMALAGCSPKAIQTVLRHSSIVLTLDHYGHLLPDEAADSIDRMPNLMAGEPIAARATGTDDRIAALSLTGDLQQKLQHSQRVEVPAHATACDDSGSMVLSIDSGKPFDHTKLSDRVRSDATQSDALEEAAESGERSICYQTGAAKTAAKTRFVEQPTAFAQRPTRSRRVGRLAAGERGAIIASSSK